MKFFIVIIVTFLAFNVDAQLLGTSNNFNRGDTLRGALRPERTCFDVHYYDLKLDLNTNTKEISGSNRMYFMAVEKFSTLQIDLFDNMHIDSILFANRKVNFRRDYNAVFVDFPNTISKDANAFIDIYYHGKPIIAKNAPWDGGFSWKKDKNNDDWIAVSCEGIGASLWWPNKDHLSDEPDSMRVSFTIPKELTFVGNGILEKNVVVKDSKTMTWKISYPINNYNVTFNIGNYVNFKDSYYSIEDSSELILDYWVMPYNLEKAKLQFKQVSPMLEAFEHYFGKFPFWNDSYKLVETPYLGMEHQTAIAYGNDYKTGYAGMDYSRIGLDFDYIIIHESGHEYWGNLVSADDVADLWIHEGFCTYSESLYVEYLFGYAKAIEYVNAKKPSVGNESPILGIYDLNHEGDGDMYNKGMIFLNTLRHTINNDELWFSILKDMATKRFAYKTINTNDVIFYFNERTGMDLTPIFMQYLAYPDIPILYYSYDKVNKKTYKLKYKWLTDVNDFVMPLILKIGNLEHRLTGSNQLQEYTFEKKKKKEKISFDENKFYFKTMKRVF